MPVVFASRYGDADRSLDLLGALVAGEPLSPTAFGLSVHNAIAAQFSITHGDRSPSVSIAAGVASAAAGVLEAAGLLADGADEVAVVCYDAPLPGDYGVFGDESPAMWAWAWRITHPKAGEPCLCLRVAPDVDSVEPSALPYGLDLLRFALQPSVPSFSRRVGGVSWHWERRHA